MAINKPKEEIAPPHFNVGPFPNLGIIASPKNLPKAIQKENPA